MNGAMVDTRAHVCRQSPWLCGICMEKKLPQMRPSISIAKCAVGVICGKKKRAIKARWAEGAVDAVIVTWWTKKK